MEYYLAPLEGITGFIYRTTYEKYFGGISKYFSPFITTNQHFAFQNRDKRDILPENNAGLHLVPQVLTNHAEQFLDMVSKIEALGYREINLNLGCPSKTVVTKKKGSGFLAYPEELDRFLDEVFYHDCGVEISVKTRIGMDEPEEFYRLLKIYNKYPIKELIIHPRLQSDYYKNKPNMEIFRESMERSKAPLCYNGDLFTVEDIRQFQEEFPQVQKIMLGRGILKTPSLLSEAQGEKRDYHTWYEFLVELCERYEEELSGDRNVLFKMKELWFYLFQTIPDEQKYVKEMRKLKDLQEYRELVKHIFTE